MRKIPLLVAMILMLSLFAVSASAVLVKFDPLGILANQSYKGSATVVPNVNITTGNTSTYLCKLYGTMNGTSGLGTWKEIETINALNGSVSNFTGITLPSGRNYSTSVFCNGTGDIFGNWTQGNPNASSGTGGNGGANWTFTVDLEKPQMVVLYPTRLLTGNDTNWIDTVRGNTSIRLGLNVTDLSPAHCVFYGTFNMTFNESARNLTLNTSAYHNDTLFNISEINASTMFKENSTGYVATVVCNDSAGNINSTGVLFKVDTYKPLAFAFNESLWRTDGFGIIQNTSICSDLKPQIAWANSSDGNLMNYRVRFYSGTDLTLSFLEMNFSSVNANRTDNNTNVRFNLSSNLALNQNYTILITAFDEAWNQVNATFIPYYTTLTTLCHNLSSGWNMCGNIGLNTSLSFILNQTQATTVSIWNKTHQFQSHVRAGANGGVQVDAGTPVLVYMNQSGLVMSDWIKNVTSTPLTENLTNGTQTNASSKYNLIMNRNYTSAGFTFAQMDVYFNSINATDLGRAGALNFSNVSKFSYYNNSAGNGTKYIPYISNKSINNRTNMLYGQVMWVWLNGSSGTLGNVSNSYFMDWQTITNR